MLLNVTSTFSALPALYHGTFWGLLRVASPPDKELYGGNLHWAVDESQQKDWSWLGFNFKVQWLCEIKVRIDELSRLSQFGEKETKQINGIFFGPKDGSCLGDFKGEIRQDQEGWKICWKVANALLQSPSSPHGSKIAQQTQPSPHTGFYDQHVPWPDAEYCRSFGL